MGGLSGLIKSFTGQSGASAARSAGREQSEAALSTIPGTEKAVASAVGRLDPYAEGGELASMQQQALLGLLGPEEQAAATEAIQESPGQAFIRKRAQRNLLRNSAAIGGIGGGNVRTALAEQGAGFGAQDLDTQRARLAGLANAGQNAATTQGGIELGGREVISNAITGAAGARASGTLGAAQARSQGVQNLITTGLGIGLLSDKNKKTDIHELDLKACYDAVINMPLKSWRYLEETGLDQDVHFGPMAQDAPEMIKIPGEEALNLHDELMMIAAAIQYMRLRQCH